MIDDRGQRILTKAFLATIITSLTISGLISCQSSPSSDGPAADETADQEEETSDAIMVDEQEDQTDVPEEQPEESYESRMKKAEQDLSKQEEARETKANTLYQKARTLLLKGEFDKALQETKHVLDLEPNHKKAEELKDTLLNLKGESTTTSARIDQIQERFDAKLQQNQVEIRSQIERSKELMEQEQYTKAKNKLSTLQTRLKGATWMDNETFNNFSSEVNSLLKKARLRASERQEAIQSKLRKQAKQKAIEAEQQRKMEELRWTDTMMRQAILHFQQEEYDQTIDVTQEVLDRFPNFQAASDLQKDARKARAGKWKTTHRQKKAEQWKNFQERMIRKRIPQTELLKFPSEEYWFEVVNQRSTQSKPISATGDQEEQQKLFSLRKKLKSKSTSLEFANTDLQNVLQTLGKKHDLNIAMDDSAREKAKKKRPVVLKDLRLGNALSVVTQKFGLRYDLREGMIFVTTPANVRPQTELQTFKTRDLVYLLNDVEDFESKGKIGLQDPRNQRENSLNDLSVQYSENPQNNNQSGDSDLPYQEGETDVQKESVDQEKKDEINLAQMVRENVAPDSWKHENTSVEQAYNGMLFVRNTPDVLAKVERFVDDLRSFAGSMVNVSVRFLVVRDEFLEHFGVEFKNANTGTSNSIIQRSDETTNRAAGIFGQNGSTSLPAGQDPSPGSDFLFHSNFQSKASQGTNDIPNPQLATLQNTGGLGLTYEVLGGTDYQAVLRALQKDDKSYVLDSTHFTLFNTQRANINIGTQKAFLQDFDVQPAAGTTAIDPVIGVVGTGLVLDVRPIISFDRRYVTLQLLPSITTDVSFRNFPVLEIGGELVALDLPQVEVKKVSTTVRLPDKGGLLLGGLTRSETLNKTQGVPVLQNIPILGALFKETVDRELGRELRILVNVEILNTSERQAEAYGGSSASNIKNSD